MFRTRLFLAAAIVIAGSSAAFADARGYCDAYARDVADRKSGAGDVLAGTVGGALAGAFLGAVIDKGEGAGKGAIIGGGAGTILGLGLSQESRKKTYRKAFARCMDQYEAQPVRATQNRNADWLDYCAAKYRSFNPRTGLYKAGSGRWRPCR